MADENRFENIGEQLHEDGDEETETTETTDDTVTNDSDETITSTQSEQDDGGPAFSFEETAQTSIYPRTKTAQDTLDDVEFDVESVLRRDYDIRDLAGRELHDAMIRLAEEYPEEIADLIVQARDE